MGVSKLLPLPHSASPVADDEGVALFECCQYPLTFGSLLCCNRRIDLLTEGEVATGFSQNTELLLDVLGGGADSGETDAVWSLPSVLSKSQRSWKSRLLGHEPDFGKVVLVTLFVCLVAGFAFTL